MSYVDVGLIMQTQYSVYPRYNVTIKKENKNIGLLGISVFL